MNEQTYSGILNLFTAVTVCIILMYIIVWVITYYQGAELEDGVSPRCVDGGISK
ncbi:hypothetical protein GL50803_0026129 [Giardia duodenalis]|uniref:Uncharacterized protein n=1 Tax=Giardia intestinalis (strain ATCC 50803 / WB clone C6) TaxID=184922 RepID=A8BEE1_GIAIC|nr:hypothetical protein GL50803_0026129 [Giardia intestinalis]KAE8305785.1 hypothetical protein GL50803_0026129 [Giardia intestinalis]|eukprot:XP_001707650.1 Hypothetical protein GL50803_26129 [Giardia lamblia ATCC 50803]